LKVLARDLDVPILAMSQLSRAVEQRHDKRPILSDLRESGCLVGDSRVHLPDDGIYRPIRDLAGRSGFRVTALNTDTWRREPRVLPSTAKDRVLAGRVAALATEVFGEQVRPRISAERTWFQVYLPPAGRLARGVRNPVAKWLVELGVFGLRSWEKHVPEKVFAQPPELIATLLRHLWATDR